MKKILFDEVTYERTPEVDAKIVDYILNVFKENHCSFSESVADNENIQCEGSAYFSEIADMLKLGE